MNVIREYFYIPYVGFEVSCILLAIEPSNSYKVVKLPMLRNLRLSGFTT